MNNSEQMSKVIDSGDQGLAAAPHERAFVTAPASPAMVSVLMSVYAKERPTFLHEALQSLADQSIPAAQLVLVCDGPLTPDLDAVIEGFVGRLPLTLVRLPRNVGLSHALNTGLSHCLHEWIARFDSDDICEIFRFERQLAYRDTHPDVDVFGSSILEFTTDASRPHAMRAVKQSHAQIVEAAKYRNPLNHVTVFVRRDVISRHGGYPHDKLNEDYALWVSLMCKGVKFGNLPEPLVRVRAGMDMVSRRGGWGYLFAEMRLQSRFRKLGFISTATFLFNVGVRVAVRLAPNVFREKVYALALRARPIDRKTV